MFKNDIIGISCHYIMLSNDTFPSKKQLFINFIQSKFSKSHTFDGWQWH